MHQRGAKGSDSRPAHDKTRLLENGSDKPLILKKVRLAVITGRDAGKEAILQKSHVSIGTHTQNDLVLTDPTVSRRHAEVEEKPDGYVIRDIGSTNGTLLDGVRVREAYLAPGSVIRLGETEIAFSRLEERIEHPGSNADRFGELIGPSIPMREVYGILERIAPTDVTVLIEGETGTGKELAARAIHSESRRAQGPFVVFDCGAVAPNLIESELFGHEKGAFTDAVKFRQGVFELADGGTVFLDEIGELSLELQPKLLRALDRREAKRIGSDRPVNFNARVIAATNKDLESEVKAGRFREDLYYRLSVVRVSMPPLRKRKDDIALIAARLLQALSAEIGKEISGLSAESQSALAAYSWPGNVRELKNVLGRAAAMCSGARIEAKDLFLTQKRKTATLDGLSGKTLEEIEKAAIQATLKSAGGNKAEAARMLGIAYSTLYEKMKKYGMRE
jgi:DNA-binding NtrC family response regulator